jgi:hypothetical protein
VLKGAAAAMRHMADHATAERGVRHGQPVLLPSAAAPRRATPEPSRRLSSQVAAVNLPTVAKRPAHPSSALGFLTAIIALVSQLALGGVLPSDGPSPQQIAALNAVLVLCDGSQPSDQGGKPDHGHRPLAPAICPLSVTLSLPSVVLTPAPALPAPSGPVLYVRAAERPPLRGPPPATARVGEPRAPPLST